MFSLRHLIEHSCQKKIRHCLIFFVINWRLDLRRHFQKYCYYGRQCLLQYNLKTINATIFVRSMYICIYGSNIFIAVIHLRTWSCIIVGIPRKCNFKSRLEFEFDLLQHYVLLDKTFPI